MKERIKKLEEKFWNNVLSWTEIQEHIRTVAAEARNEGIDKMRDALLGEWEDNEIRCGIIILHAERLKEEKS